MEYTEVPNRPPPPPPLQMGLAADRSNPNYIDFPEQVASPPSISDHLMAPSPSEPLYSPYSSTGSDRLSRSFTNDRTFPRDLPPIPGQQLEPISPSPADEAAARERHYRDETREEVFEVAYDEYDENEDQPEEPEEEEEEDDDEEPPELPPIIVITGAASGLGLSLFQHFSEADPSPGMKYDVLGVDRPAWRLPGKGFQWQTTIGKCGKYVQLDLTASAKRLDSWAENHLYATVTNEKGRKRRWPRPVSMLIHCADARGRVPEVEQALLAAAKKANGRGDNTATAAATTVGPAAAATVGPTPPPPPPPPAAAAAAAEALEVMDAETMRRAYDVNVVGTLQLIQAVLPHLQLHAGWLKERQDEVTEAFGGSTEWLDQLRQQGSRASLVVTRPLPPREPPARVVLVSSRMASVDANRSGGGYAYRASRAAMNAVMKSLSIDVPEVCFASVNPGNVAPGSGQEKDGDVISCEECIEELLPLIEKMGDGKLASGCFVDRFGDPIKW